MNWKPILRQCLQISSRSRGVIWTCACLLILGCTDLPVPPDDIDAYPSEDLLVPDSGLDRGPEDPFMGDASQPFDMILDGGSMAVEDLGMTVLDLGYESTQDARMDSSDGSPLEPAAGEPVYSAQHIYSGLPADLITGLMDIYDRGNQWQDDVFLKAGASSTVSRNTLHCFAGDEVDLGVHDHLRDTLEFFLQGNASGSTPFDRVTVAARVGHSAGWVIEGDPSPLAEEREAILPRFALIHYGTNDMGLGSTFASAARGFYDHMSVLTEELTDEGIIPMLIGISPRGDRVSADQWVHTYNAIIRGIAQARGLPFIDLFNATESLDGFGLAGDGIHLNRAPDGACILDEPGLGYGYNVRNLIVLESLDRVRRAVLEGETSGHVNRMPGDGTYETPFIVPELPFADSRDTSLSTYRVYDQYGACDDADESGPEFVYRWTTDRPRRIRAMVLDSGLVDIDVHLLGEDGTPETCLERDHHMIETTVPAGQYHFVLDTFTSANGTERSGSYLFVLVDCDERDAACD